MLEFAPFEKNLFGQTRSWSAPAGEGRYVIVKLPAADAFQAIFELPEAKPAALHEAALPSFERARKLCDQDAGLRQRQRIIAKARKRQGR
jgi:hypothetical protein